MELYTMKEASNILGVSIDTIRRRCCEGVLERININPKSNQPSWRISKKSIEKFLAT